MYSSGIVLKYGGTSLATADLDKRAIQQVVDTHRGEVSPEGCTLFDFSGCGKTDDTEKGRKATDHAVDIVRGIHPQQEWKILESILRGNVRAHGFPQGIINPLIRKAKQILESGNIDLEATPYIVGLPERCKGKTLLYLARHTVPDSSVILCDFDTNGMMGVNDGSFTNVPVAHELTLQEIDRMAQKYHWRGKIVLGTGFIARQQGTNKLITLERGTSDAKSTYDAAALWLDEVRIYSDQDGYLPVDPALYKGLRPVSELSYEEAEACAGLRGQIINDVAIRPARERRIPVRLLNSFNSASPGTWIRSCAPSLDHYGVKAITTVPGYLLVRVGNMRMKEPGIAQKVAGIFSAHGCSIDSEVDADRFRTYAIIPPPKLYELIDEFTKAGHPLQLESMKTRIALVGEGMDLVRKIGRSTAEDIFRGIVADYAVPVEMQSWVEGSAIRSAFIPQQYASLMIHVLVERLGFKKNRP